MPPRSIFDCCHRSRLDLHPRADVNSKVMGQITGHGFWPSTSLASYPWPPIFRPPFYFHLCGFWPLLILTSLGAARSQLKITVVALIVSRIELVSKFSGAMFNAFKCCVTLLLVCLLSQIRIVFHFTSRIPTILLWPSASATCIYDIDYELQGIALYWHHQLYWVGIIISKVSTKGVGCRDRHRDP